MKASGNIVAFLLALVLAPCGRAADLPLFQSSEALQLTLEFPVETLVREKSERPVLDGMLRFSNADGEAVEIEMSMTTRGKSRLAYCRFPPLTLNLKRKQARGTVFDGQNKLKIVTHCRNGNVHQRYLHQEYGIYRAFNVLSEYSYRVRLLRITYRDSEGKRDDEVQDAFFIESHNEVALRRGMERSRVEKIRPEQLDYAQAATFILFQYLIANTDWSMFKGPGEDGCCHNGKVIIEPGTALNWIVLPYDFDQAGLINTKYSMPAEALGIRTVRQRLYRGRCVFNDQLPATVALFNAKRAEIEKEIIPAGLNKRSSNSSLKYIDEFYRTINDPKQFERRITGDCVGNSN